ncbi:MAG: DUF4079 domain-containing protein, partial [Leptolyngbyaceae cyanobacterium CAN_BIN12]|nr:DUF4079 domain-containing protein [Leptolyngbyaceae cyanobacterium CAN_BIN12]
WLWRIAAWSMGLSWLAYLLLGISGLWMRSLRQKQQIRPDWLRPMHFLLGLTLALLVLVLLAIGIVGTLGEYGRLGHSVHLISGLVVVYLVLLSAWSAVQISTERLWARQLHVGINAVLLAGFIGVSVTGWTVVQKYLP